MKDSDLEIQPLSLPARPFIGFVPRVAAAAIDLVLLYFIGYTLELAFREPLMQLGWGLQLLGAVGIYAYFWIGNSRVANGTTLGKAIINIKTVRADGQPLGLGAAAGRAALQAPFVYVMLFNALAGATGMALTVAEPAHDVLVVLALALLGTHSYCIFTHPHRATWYDRLAGSYVTRDPAPAGLAEALAAGSQDELEQRRQKFQNRLSIVFFVIIVAFFGNSTMQSLASPERRAQLRMLERLNEEAPVDDYALEMVTSWSGRQRQSFELMVLHDELPGAEEVDGGESAGEDVGASDAVTTGGEGVEDAATTPTAVGDGLTTAAVEDNAGSVTAVGDEAGTVTAIGDEAVTVTSIGDEAATVAETSTVAGEGSEEEREEPRGVLYFQFTKRRGVATPAELEDPEIREEVERLRRLGPELWAETTAELGIEAELPPDVMFYFTDHFRLFTDQFGVGVLSMGDRGQWVARGPIDPAEGPLTYEWIEPPAE